VVAGDEQTYYGWDRQHTGGVPFNQWVLSRGDYDPSRFVFLGHVEPEVLAGVLRRSDLHVYLGVPFVLSWSVFNALASGCVVLAGDVPPVREVIEPGRTDLLEPLIDIDRLTEAALCVLEGPAQFRPLGEAARRLMEERYSFSSFEGFGNMLALAVGFNAMLQPNRLAFGAVYTTSLAAQNDFGFNGVLVKMILRY
jgi:glycosyltransferase involved in cell wall biosynthesis